MDQQDTSQTSLSQPPAKKNWLKTLLFLEIGIFEIGFVLVLLFLILSALVFFRVIDVHNSILRNTFFARFAPPAPAPTLSLPSQNPTIIADMKHTLSDTLQASFIPTSFHYTTAPSATLTSTLNTITWNTHGLNGSLTLRYRIDNHALVTTILSAQIAKPAHADILTSQNIARVAGSILLPQARTWDCTPNTGKAPETTTCVALDMSTSTKTGYQVRSTNNQPSLQFKICSLTGPSTTATTLRTCLDTTH